MVVVVIMVMMMCVCVCVSVDVEGGEVSAYTYRHTTGTRNDKKVELKTGRDVCACQRIAIVTCLECSEDGVFDFSRLGLPQPEPNCGHGLPRIECDVCCHDEEMQMMCLSVLVRARTRTIEAS